MLRTTLFWKLMVGMLAILTIAHGVGGWIAHVRIAEVTRREVENELTAQLALLEEKATPFLASAGREAASDGMQTDLQILRSRTGSRITLIEPGGLVVAESDVVKFTQMENHLQREEIQAALAAGPGHPAFSSRSSHSTGEVTLYAAVLLRAGGKDLGFLRVAKTLDRIVAQQAELWNAIAIAALVSVLVAFALTALFARAVTRPLRKMNDLARTIASGVIDKRVEIETSDEVGELGKSLNAMADQLAARLETIQRDRNNLLAVLSDMTEGVVAVDKEQRVLHINEVAATFLGASATEALGRPVWEVTRVRQVCDALARVQEADQELGEELELAGAQEPRTLDLKASPLRDGKGRAAGAVVVLHDLTRLRKLELVRRDFVANVSHELKTPLTAIRGYVETLLDDPEMVPETRARFLEKVNNQTQRLSSLVTDLLTLSRVESGRDVLDKSPFDLREPARLSAAALQSQAHGKDLTLAVELPEDPVVVRGDAEAMRVATDNLIGNAIQYTPARGRIDVRVRATSQHAVLEVADTGIGIEKSQQERIFERFYRVDKARSRELGGTGLGLAIVKHIVLAHGGQVSVESEVGHGSTFRVRLPLDLEHLG